MEELTGAADAMSRAISHRGPDDAGRWADPTNGIAFGFRRLAIIDLSEHGHQPMVSRSGRFTVVFNGEIYNHPELSAELGGLGHRFRGHSDTEVALAAFEEWGVEESMARFIGMFAMGIWDAERRSLWLVRDRLGIKPLFVYSRSGLIAFASELKSLVALPDFTPEIDIASAAAYFRYLYVPAPMSIYRGVSKLLPGHLLELRAADRTLPDSRAYWSAAEVARQGHSTPFEGDDADAVNAVESTLLDAVRLRLRADVPVGAFLSGGVDSSTVVALMQEVSSRPARTFTIGFDVGEHDESAEASAVARHLGTDHREIHLSGSDALELVSGIPDIFDEPLADPSQLPTYLICRAARQEVTVALSGDGGDELFAGYNRYAYGSRVIERATRIPRSARQLVGRGLTSVRPDRWDRLYGGAASIMRKPGQRLVGEKVHKLGNLLREPTEAAMYRSLVSAWKVPPVRDLENGESGVPGLPDEPSLSLVERMMLTDQQRYLPDDLLAKVDRTSMAVSLEVRVPILDHRVVELSWHLPQHVKLRNGQGKWVLRQVLYRRVPRALVDRPKVGFSVPLGDWLRGPLRGWAEDRLAPSRLAELPWLDGKRVRDTWDGFLARRNNDHLEIWTILMFEAWRERWIS
jgi:asparagine synthase (glutamine-hydrolysing)